MVGVSSSPPPVPGSVPAPASFVAQGLLGPLLYSALRHKELVVEVDLGPFKHIKDEGLPCRKAAITALAAIAGLASSGPALLLPPPAVAPFLIAALSDDQPDVRVLSHTLLQKLLLPLPASGGGASDWGEYLLSNHLPALTAVLDSTINKMTSAAAGGAPAPAPAAAAGTPSTDIIRAALRSLRALSSRLQSLPVSGGVAARCPQFGELCRRVDSSESLAALLASVTTGTAGAK